MQCEVERPLRCPAIHLNSRSTASRLPERANWSKRPLVTISKKLKPRYPHRVRGLREPCFQPVFERNRLPTDFSDEARKEEEKKRKKNR